MPPSKYGENGMSNQSIKVTNPAHATFASYAPTQAQPSFKTTTYPSRQGIQTSSETVTRFTGAASGFGRTDSMTSAHKFSPSVKTAPGLLRKDGFISSHTSGSPLSAARHMTYSVFPDGTERLKVDDKGQFRSSFLNEQAKSAGLVPHSQQIYTAQEFKPCANSTGFVPHSPPKYAKQAFQPTLPSYGCNKKSATEKLHPVTEATLLRLGIDKAKLCQNELRQSQNELRQSLHERRRASDDHQLWSNVLATARGKPSATHRPIGGNTSRSATENIQAAIDKSNKYFERTTPVTEKNRPWYQHTSPLLTSHEPKLRHDLGNQQSHKPKLTMTQFAVYPTSSNVKSKVKQNSLPFSRSCYFVPSIPAKGYMVNQTTSHFPSTGFEKEIEKYLLANPNISYPVRQDRGCLPKSDYMLYQPMKSLPLCNYRVTEFTPDPPLLPSPCTIGTPQEKPIDTPQGKPFDKPQDKTIEIPKDKPIDTPQDKTISTPLDKPIDTPQHKPVDTPQDNPIDTSQDKPIEIPKDKTIEMPKDKAFSTPQNKPIDAPQDKTKVTMHDPVPSIPTKNEASATLPKVFTQKQGNLNMLLNSVQPSSPSESNTTFQFGDSSHHADAPMSFQPTDTDSEFTSATVTEDESTTVTDYVPSDTETENKVNGGSTTPKSPDRSSETAIKNGNSKEVQDDSQACCTCGKPKDKTTNRSDFKKKWRKRKNKDNSKSTRPYGTPGFSADMKPTQSAGLCFQQERNTSPKSTGGKSKSAGRHMTFSVFPDGTERLKVDDQGEFLSSFSNEHAQPNASKNGASTAKTGTLRNSGEKNNAGTPAISNPGKSCGPIAKSNVPKSCAASDLEKSGGETKSGDPSSNESGNISCCSTSSRKSKRKRKRKRKSASKGLMKKTPLSIDNGKKLSMPAKSDVSKIPSTPAKSYKGKRSSSPAKLDDIKLPSTHAKSDDGKIPSTPAKSDDGKIPSAPAKSDDGKIPSTPAKSDDGKMSKTPSKSDDGKIPSTPAKSDDGKIPSTPAKSDDGKIPSMPAKSDDGKLPSTLPKTKEKNKSDSPAKSNSGKSCGPLAKTRDAKGGAASDLEKSGNEAKSSSESGNTSCCSISSRKSKRKQKRKLKPANNGEKKNMETPHSKSKGNRLSLPAKVVNSKTPNLPAKSDNSKGPNSPAKLDNGKGPNLPAKAVNIKTPNLPSKPDNGKRSTTPVKSDNGKKPSTPPKTKEENNADSPAKCNPGKCCGPLAKTSDAKNGAASDLEKSGNEAKSGDPSSNESGNTSCCSTSSHKSKRKRKRKGKSASNVETKKTAPPLLIDNGKKTILPAKSDDTKKPSIPAKSDDSNIPSTPAKSVDGKIPSTPSKANEGKIAGNPAITNEGNSSDTPPKCNPGKWCGPLAKTSVSKSGAASDLKNSGNETKSGDPSNNESGKISCCSTSSSKLASIRETKKPDIPNSADNDKPNAK